MKLVPYTIISIILMCGSYIIYTLYSPYYQSNIDNLEEKNILKNENIKNEDFDNLSYVQDLKIKNNLSSETKFYPEVDIIKVLPDGSFIIAGKGKPNSKIKIFNKGVLIESTIVDEAGSWIVVSKENLEAGDNLISIDQIETDGIIYNYNQLFITKIDGKKTLKPLIISVPNEKSSNISIIQKPTKIQKSTKVEENLNINNKIKNNQNMFSVKTIFFDEKGIISIQGIANYGEKIEVFINEQLMEIILNNIDPKWEYNSDKSLDFGLHNLLVILKSQKNEILDKIALPFMRVEMPSENIPDNFILIKPGDMLWTIAYRIYGDPLKYIQIFEENKDQITNPDLIFPGQLFSIPIKK